MQIFPKVARFFGLGAGAVLVAVLALSLGGCKAPSPTAAAEQGGSSLAAATSLAKQAIKTPESKNTGKTRPAKVSATLPALTQAPLETLPAPSSTSASPAASTSTPGPTPTQPAQVQVPTATTRLASRTQSPTPASDAATSSTATSTSAAAQPTNTLPAPTATTKAAGPTATSPASGSSILITGRVLRDGTGASDIVIQLEAAQILTTTTDTSGIYTFTTQSLEGEYSVTFSQEANPALHTDNQVASWAWLDSYVPAGITRIEMPELEISLVLNGKRFEQQSPAANESISASSISRANPLRFEWSEYPEPTGYWVDLGRENELTPAWQSFFTNTTFFNFTGLLSNGASISPGSYWWNIGMQKSVGTHTFTVYGQPRLLTITP